MNLELVRNTPLSSPKGTPVNEFLETDEKGIYAAGDIALYPDRVYGGVRRTDHWDNARQQGLLVGANMTGKKRQRYDFMPRYASVAFDLKFQFLGDFGGGTPMRPELEGSREKKVVHRPVLCRRQAAGGVAVQPVGREVRRSGKSHPRQPRQGIGGDSALGAGARGRC